MTGPFGWRRVIAIVSASPTRSAGIRGAIAQPTIRRLHASSTTARYSHPAQVRTYVMSATHSWSGPSAEKSRLTRSGAGRALASLFLVPRKRLRVTPSMPSSPIRRATRLRPTRSPLARSAAWIRGQP